MAERNHHRIEYSILLASRNEGNRLRRTVDSIFRSSAQEEFEVIIVDDASEDGSAGFLQGPEYEARPIRLFRNRRRRGVIYSRALAADLGRGRCLVFLDAHCSVTEGWVENLAAELDKISGRGIVVPHIHGLEPSDWSIHFKLPPATGCTIINPFLDFNWTEPTEIDGRSCTCTIGGGAWMCRREWYRHLGGLDRGMLAWGGENLDIALRTWLAGGWCLVAGKVSIGHYFKTNFDNSLIGFEVTHNKIRAAHHVFSKGTFDRVMQSLRHLPGFQPALRRIHRDREALGRLKGHVESIRERNDGWIIDAFKLPILEPAYFHSPYRKRVPTGASRAAARPHPLVTVVIPMAERAAAADELLSSIFDKSTYRCFEVLILTSAKATGLPSRRLGQRFQKDPRLRLVSTTASWTRALSEDRLKVNRQSEYLALASDRTAIADENWIEKFILLAEKHPRMLLAGPRFEVTGDAGASAGPFKHLFDLVWDWSAPSFFRQRLEKPLAGFPYQALSCPPAFLFMHRRHFLESGGFDPTLPWGSGQVFDLAIRGWLLGYETFCHPQIRVRCRDEAMPAEQGGSDRSSSTLKDYAQLAPAWKYFTNAARLGHCRNLSPNAGPLLEKHGAFMRRCRRRVLQRAKFDDDWLFFKFHIQDPFHAS